jgi:hypothetical protein
MRLKESFPTHPLSLKSDMGSGGWTLEYEGGQNEQIRNKLKLCQKPWNIGGMPNLETLLIGLFLPAKLTMTECP